MNWSRAFRRCCEDRPTSKRDALTLGNVSFETESRQAVVAGKLLFLPPREAEVLEVLLKRGGRTVSHESLESQVFGMSQNVSSNAIEVYVHRLRHILADAGANVAIHTIRGVGYLMEEAKDDPAKHAKDLHLALRSDESPHPEQQPQGPSSNGGQRSRRCAPFGMTASLGAIQPLQVRS